MGKVTEPPIPRRAIKSLDPLRSFSPPHTLRPISQKQTGSEGVQTGLDAQRSVGQMVTITKMRSWTPLCNVDSHQQVTRGRGTADITTNQPEQMIPEPGP